jgi:hypothetical protein
MANRKGIRMRRSSLLAVILFTAAAANAATIFNVTGPSPFGFANQTVLVTGWSQLATYNNVTITAPLEDNSSGGPIAGTEGVVYLVNHVGPGTTAANEVAPPVSISGLTNAFTTRTLFTGLTLGPGNYYLVFASTNSNPLSMSMEGSSTPTVTVGTAVTSLGSDGQVTPAPYPPATSVTLTQPANLFVDVSGTFVSLAPVIPMLSPWVLLLLAGTLLVVGAFRIAMH